MPHKFLSYGEPLKVHHKHLPHWRQDGVTYFVTARLADSMPQSKLEQWERLRSAWLWNHRIESVEQVKTLPPEQQKEFHKQFNALWHSWLDAGYGACQLAKPEVRLSLLDVFYKNESTAYELDAWVIMPNHFHAVVSLKSDTQLGAVLKHWKGGSAREINKLLNRQGSLWQAESYDHIVRSEAQLQHYRRYIANNPIHPRLRSDEYVIGLGKTTWPSAQEFLDSLPANIPNPSPSDSTEVEATF